MMQKKVDNLQDIDDKRDSRKSECEPKLDLAQRAYVVYIETLFVPCSLLQT